jgi:hypothetical protein
MKDLFLKLTRSRFSLVFLVIFVAVLYYVLNNGIMPWVMDILKSNAFYEKGAQEEEQLGRIENKTPRIAYALANCKDAVKDEGDLPEAAQFMDDKYEAWALGNRHYIIRSGVRIIDPEQGQVDKLFACKLRMVADDEANPDSWSILGVEFNEPSDAAE